MGATATLTGGEEVKQKLVRMNRGTKRCLRDAARRVAAIHTRAIKSNLKRRRTGLLAKSIGSKVKERGNGVTAISGPRRGFTVTLKSVGLKMRKTKFFGPGAGLVRDSDGNFVGEAVGERKGKKIKLTFNASKRRLFAQRTKGKRKGEDIVISATKYAHLIEAGHKRGAGRGAAKAFPFMRPAFEQTKSQVKGEVHQAALQVITL